MTIIQSHTDIRKPIAEVYTFLTDMNNHEQLMPDNIINWSSTTDEARFTIKNMAELALKINQRVANKEIVCVPIGEAPFEITLRWILQEKEEQVTTATFVIEAQLNMMMKMMASGPLQKLANHQVLALQQVFAS